VIGVNAVAKSPADGYTIGFINLPAASGVFNRELPYNPDKDFDPIVGIYRAVYALAVSTSLPAKTAKELVDYAKANPGKLNFAAHVITARLTTETLTNAGGVKMVPIQYKGTAPALQALLTNEIQVMVDLPGVFGPLVKDGKARMIAVTGDQRIGQLPDVPSMAEAGFPQVRSALTVGFWGPAGIPADARAKLTAAFAEAIRSPEVTARMNQDGVTPNPSAPEELRARYRAEVDFWAEAAKLANFKPE
jgi:tripartite-type tricarboxylate transporter receptor subunit TctC